MDFFIDDDSEKQENSKKARDGNIFIGNYVKFVNIDAFQKQYMTSEEYNDPTLSKLGLSSFKLLEKCLEASYEDNSGPKLR